MKEITLYKWQFKNIEPGKRVKRRLSFTMTEEDAREGYGDAIEKQPGSAEVRRGQIAVHSVEPMQHLHAKKPVSPAFAEYLEIRARQAKS